MSKILFYFSLCMLGVIACLQTKAQGSNGMDSGILKKANILGDSLNLSTSQRYELYLAIRACDSSCVALDGLNLSELARQQSLVQINQQYKTSLQSLMTAGQWEAYLAYLERQRQAFQQRHNNQRIRVKEIL